MSSIKRAIQAHHNHYLFGSLSHLTAISYPPNALHKSTPSLSSSSTSTALTQRSAVHTLAFTLLRHSRRPTFASRPPSQSPKLQSCTNSPRRDRWIPGGFSQAPHHLPSRSISSTSPIKYTKDMLLPQNNPRATTKQLPDSDSGAEMDCQEICSIVSSDSSPDSSDISATPTPDCASPATKSPNDFSTTLAKYSLTSQSLIHIKNSLITLAHEAGDMMLSAHPSLSTSTAKRNTSDLVTATDRAIEILVHSRLRSTYPAILFLGEETFLTGQKLTSSPTFVCDPIDGTLNFIHAFPNTAISLALTIEREPVVGVVYNPFRDELYTAIKNQGAYLTTPSKGTQRLPLHSIPAPLPSLSSSLVAVEWGSQRSGPNWDLRTSMSKSLLSSSTIGGAMVHSIRSSGSAALDFCYVAAGQIDVFWEGGCWIWDVCAGWCILEEAGGIVASANPGDWEPEVEGRCYLAVRGAKRREQEGVVREVWGLMGESKFVF